MLVQRIITPERIYEFPVSAEPWTWYRGVFPTSVYIDGSLPEELLENLKTYALQYGWRWNDEMNRFYPTE